jgi:hypothetical protein
MKWRILESLAEGKFRRLTGIKKLTFIKMLEILTNAQQAKKKKGGRNPKLCIEDMLLMTLEYLREYRTYFHISQSYGVSESTSYKIVRWIEDTLIKHPDFSLPGRKVLLKSDIRYGKVLIDATETPIERPKKTEVFLLR